MEFRFIKSEKPQIDTNKYYFLDIQYAITQLTGKNEASLLDFLQNLTNCAKDNPDRVSSFAQNKEIVDPFTDALISELDETKKIKLL